MEEREGKFEFERERGGVTERRRREGRKRRGKRKKGDVTKFGEVGLIYGPK